MMMGGAGIEGEAILPEHARPPPWLLELLEHGDAIALCAKPDGGRQPPKPLPITAAWGLRSEAWSVSVNMLCH